MTFYPNLHTSQCTVYSNLLIFFFFYSHPSWSHVLLLRTRPPPAKPSVSWPWHFLQIVRSSRSCYCYVHLPLDSCCHAFVLRSLTSSSVPFGWTSFSPPLPLRFYRSNLPPFFFYLHTLLDPSQPVKDGTESQSAPFSCSLSHSSLNVAFVWCSHVTWAASPSTPVCSHTD